jgi:hypothetical protein
MDVRIISASLVGLGTALLFGAILWWEAFYRTVTNGNPGQAIRCVYLCGGPCGVIGGIAQMAGKISYTPVVLWLSVAMLICGVVIEVLHHYRSSARG